MEYEESLIVFCVVIVPLVCIAAGCVLWLYERWYVQLPSKPKPRETWTNFGAAPGASRGWGGAIFDRPNSTEAELSWDERQLINGDGQRVFGAEPSAGQPTLMADDGFDEAVDLPEVVRGPDETKPAEVVAVLAQPPSETALRRLIHRGRDGMGRT